MQIIGGRLFYVSQCAAEFWSVEALKSNLRGDVYTKTGALPNNFLRTLPESEQARRAIRAFKDEYFLDFINIEEGEKFYTPGIDRIPMTATRTVFVKVQAG